MASSNLSYLPKDTSYTTSQTIPSQRNNWVIEDNSRQDTGGESGLVVIDKPFRRSLEVTGLLTGPVSTVKSLYLRRLAYIYQAAFLLILSVYVFCSISVVILEGIAEDQDRGYLIFVLKIQNVLISSMNLLMFVATIVSTNRKSCLAAYYEQLRVVEETFKRLNIEIPFTTTKRVLVVLLALGWAAGCFTAAEKLRDYSTSTALDPIYDLSLYELPYVNSTQTYHAFRGLAITSNIILGFYIFLPFFYFLFLHYMVYKLFKVFNNKLLCDVTSSPCDVIKDIQRYRVTHLKLCKLASDLNDTVKYVLGLLVSLSIIQVIILLYMMSQLVSNYNRQDVSLFSVLAYYLGGGVFGVLTMVFVGDSLQNVVSMTTFLSVLMFLYTYTYYLVRLLILDLQFSIEVISHSTRLDCV